MKKYLIAPIAFLLLHLIPTNINAQVFLYEGFEAGGGIPTGWNDIKVIGDKKWEYVNGGGYSYDLPDFKYPPTAYAGGYNALFQSQGTTNSRRLVSPLINTSFAIKPVLSFWLAQDQWIGVDELTVKYRTKSYLPWNTLETYSTIISNWVKKEIILPEDAKTSSLQIAFEAKSNYGWGVCIDEVTIDERGVLPRIVNAVNLYQVNDIIPSNTEGNPIVFAEIEITGNTGDLTLSQTKFNYTGTNINDINSFRLYYTKDSIFSPALQIVGTLSVVGNDIQFTGFNQLLQTGYNYIWLCADVKTSAAHGNIIDAQLPANAFTINSSTYPAISKSPTGSCRVEQSILRSNFEGTSSWSLSHSWQEGVPLGGGTYDPNHPFAGTRVLATNLNGNYPANISEADPHIAVSPITNSKYFKDVNLRYYRWLNIESTDKARVWLSNNNGTTWVKIMENEQVIQDRSWKRMSHNISSLATRKSEVLTKFAIDLSDNSTEYGGWNVDNFAVTGDFIASDVGVKGLVIPNPYCGLTNAEEVRVTLKNYGGATVNTPFEVGYSLDGGVNFVKEVFSGSINSEQELVFTFAQKADFSAPGLKQLVFKTFLTGDEDSQNDTYSQPFYVFPSATYPYTTSFESSTAFWYSSGQNNSWAWGVPQGTILNKASNGTKAWATNLKLSYNNNEKSYLESPCFNLSTSQYPMIRFDYMMLTEVGEDGFNIEYSINGGQTWALLPASANYSENWYNTPNVTALAAAGWSENQNNFVTASTLLPNDAKVNGVKFRFVFASTPNNTYEGVVIDQIKIIELPTDVGITQFITPVNACEIGNVKITFKVENIGYRPVPSGTVIPIKVKVDNKDAVDESLTLATTLNQGGYINFTTLNNYDLSLAGLHDVAIYTNLNPDLHNNNDTLNHVVEVIGLPQYTLGPDIGTLNPDTVILDAGSGFQSYQWRTKIPKTAPTWTNGPTDQTYDVTAGGFGLYEITVTKTNGCSATNVIEIINSDQDVQVTSINNIASSCEHNDLIQPQVTVKHNSGSNFDGSKSFNIALDIDGIEVLSESYTPVNGWNPGSTANFTFAGSINLSAAKLYNIKAYTKFVDDINKSNDTVKIDVSTYGIPVVEIPVADTIITAKADSLVFVATSGFNTYKWERMFAGTSTWEELVGYTTNTLNLAPIPNSLRSAWYRVTVTAGYGCGEGKDSVFVNARDLGVYSIVLPADTVCLNATGYTMQAQIQNYGQDVYQIGEVIKTKLVTPSGEQIFNTPLVNALNPGQRITIELPQPILLNEGLNSISFFTNMDEDPNSENDSKSKFVLVAPNPTVAIEPDTLKMLFTPETVYTISPTYSADCESYLWNDNSTMAINYIYGSPAFDVYKVVAKNLYGCSATDSLVVVTSDLAITNILIPTNNCEFASTPYEVKFRIQNLGPKLLAGSQFDATLYLDGALQTTETITLATDLNAQATRDFTMAATLDLFGFTSANIDITINPIGMKEISTTNNTISKSVYATGYPTVDLGSDRNIHAYSEILHAGKNFSTYKWQDNSTDSTFTATQTGTYSVTVTDFAGCSGSDEVTLTFFIDDLTVTSLNSPTSGCSLSTTENVSLTIKNNGTFNIPSGTSIELGYILEGVKTTENHSLAADLLPNETRVMNMSAKMNLSVNKTYNIKVWAKYSADINVTNDTLSTPVTSHAPVLVNLGADKSACAGQSVPLNAGSFPGATYLWSTGATTQTISVTLAGTYSVTVTDANGCIGNDNINVTINSLPTVTLSDLSPTCSNTTPYELTGGSPSGGTYTGTGVSSNIFNPSVAGSGNHTITYTYKDANTCQNSASKPITVNKAPTINLGSDLTIGTPLVLNPGTFSSYMWQDGSTNQTYTVNATGTYYVTVTDANGCTAYDEVNIVYLETIDVIISSLISPITQCYKSDAHPVTVEVTNRGGNTFVAGSKINARYRIGSNSPVTEEITLTADFAPNDKREYTFTENISLPAADYTFTCYTIVNGNKGDSIDYNVKINPLPNFSFISDTIRVSASNINGYVINSGVNYPTYNWSTGATSPNITINQHGKYWLRVTDANNCSTSDTIVVWWPVSTEIISGIDATIKLFPNPVKDKLNILIESEKAYSYTIEVMNPQGMLVQKQRTLPSSNISNTIDVEDLTPGMYLLKVSTEKGSAVFKIIVTKD